MPAGSFVNAINNLSTEQCRIMFVGDSLLEGQGATTLETRMQHKVLEKLNTRYSLTPSTTGQYKPFYYSGGEPVSASWGRYGIRSSEEGGVEDNTSYSVGSRGYIIWPGNYWELPTQSFRYIEVQYTEVEDLAISTMQLADITNGIENLELVGPVYDTSTGGAGIRPGKRFVYDFGSNDTRTVAIMCHANGVIVDGVTFYGTDPEAGITILDASASGLASNGATDTSASWHGWQNMDADLIIDDLWHNDYLGNSATPAVSAARMVDRIDRYRAIRADIDIIALMIWDIPGHNDSTENSLGHTFGEYRDAIRQVCYEKAVWKLDLSRYMSADVSMLIADQIHLNDAGQEQLAVIIEQFMGEIAEGNETQINETSPVAMHVGSNRVDRVYHGDHLVM